MKKKQIFALILSIAVFPLLPSTPHDAPYLFGKQPLSMGEQEFSHLLDHPERRRAQKTTHITKLHEQFKNSITGNTVRADMTGHFLNSLWLSSMDRQQVLDGAKKVSQALAQLAKEAPNNQLITHLNAAVNAHKTPALPDLMALKRQYSRSAQNDYRAAQPIHKMLFHNPGVKVGLLASTSVLGSGIGLHMLKRYNKSTEMMALQHHVLRHKIIQQFGTSNIAKLKDLLTGITSRGELSAQEQAAIERYLKLDEQYRKQSKNLVKYAAGTALGGLGALGSAIAYQQQTPLKNIK